MYTKSELLTHLHELADELGRTPTTKDMRTADQRPSVPTYRNQFGSWNAALEEAELEPTQKGNHYDDNELLRHLQELADKLGRTPAQKHMNAADGRPSVDTYKRHFGSWNAALEEAELEPTRKQKRPYDTGELLTHLQELADELERTPTQRDMNAADARPSVQPYQNRFGSWNAALKEAELEPNRKQTQSYDDNELLRHVQELADELERTPTARDIRAADDRPSVTPYQNRFGSWNAALKEAELEPTQNGNHYDDNELLRHLQELADELGRTPTEKEMNTADSRPSMSTYYRRFGSWTAAIEAAGLRDE